MNQILMQQINPMSKIPKKRYQLQLIVSCIFATMFLFVILMQWYQNYKMQNISQELLNHYSITTLYAPNENLSVVKAKIEQSVSNPFVIGMIRIDKIKLSYPILSQNSRELLKISLCRFAGPMPNEIGNLCIAGHNLVDNHFFSSLHELEKGDVISIFDLSGTEIVYAVCDKYEVIPTDWSCASQSVGNDKIITLLTCNNVNGKRLVVRAKEIH